MWTFWERVYPCFYFFPLPHLTFTAFHVSELLSKLIYILDAFYSSPYVISFCLIIINLWNKQINPIHSFIQSTHIFKEYYSLLLSRGTVTNTFFAFKNLTISWVSQTKKKTGNITKVLRVYFSCHETTEAAKCFSPKSQKWPAGRSKAKFDGFPYFTNEEAMFLKGYMTCSRLCSYKVKEPRDKLILQHHTLYIK